jgi:hypothetical protein
MIGPVKIGNVVGEVVGAGKSLPSSRGDNL